ncbi:MAG: hypothetical protein JOY66_17875 [Acetobacteraceae bacterium]|nr:hypothetical protein [Acetobacteraceae bacterium]
MIPKRLHYVWVGGPLPDLQRAYIESWRQTNPDYEVVGWNESNIDFSVPMIRAAFQERKWAKVADIVRLMAVAEQGGIYFDTDFKVLKSLEPTRRHACFFAFQEPDASPDWVANGVFGAEPGHRFVHKALERLLSKRRVPLGLERPTSFGPKLITQLLREEGLATYSPDGVQVGDVFVYPTPVFFPFTWRERFDPSCIGEATLAVHFWEKSWDRDVPLPLRLARSARSLVRSHLR